MTALPLPAPGADPARTLDDFRARAVAAADAADVAARIERTVQLLAAYPGRDRERDRLLERMRVEVDTPLPGVSVEPADLAALQADVEQLEAQVAERRRRRDEAEPARREADRLRAECAARRAAADDLRARLAAARAAEEQV